MNAQFIQIKFLLLSVKSSSLLHLNQFAFVLTQLASVSFPAINLLLIICIYELPPFMSVVSLPLSKYLSYFSFIYSEAAYCISVEK